PRFVRVATNVGANAIQVFTIDVDPRRPRRVRCFPQDVCAVVYAVEVDPLTVVPNPIVWWGREANHRSKRRPGVDMRHHLVVSRACWYVIRPPHNAWNAPSSLER